MFILSLLLISLVAGIAAIAAAQNPTPVMLAFLAVRSVELPLGILLVLALGLGLVTVPLLAILLGQKQRFSQSARQLKIRLGDLESGS